MAELIVGPFLGVIGAFATQRSYEWHKNNTDRKKLKQNLKNELIKCDDLLIGKGNLIPTTMWLSAISSGDLRLLSFIDKAKLSSIYFEIENYNYEAKRVRDSAIIAQTDSNSREICDGMPPARAYWVTMSKNLIRIEELLKQKIIELLKNQIWDK